MMPIEAPDSLCVVCPAYNEEEAVVQFYGALKAALDTLHELDYEIVFVDDGSQDGTLDALNVIADRDPRVKVYSLSRNFGHQIALSAGLDVADASAVVMMDSDLQHPPALIPEMVRRWREGNDIVSAVRETTQGASLFKRLSSNAFYWLINSMSDTRIPVGAADFCLLSRRAHRAMLEMPERHRFLRGLVSWMGFNRAFVSFVAPERVAGESKYNARKMINLAVDAVLSFSATPMRAATRFGLMLVFLGFTYLAYIVVRGVVLGDLVAGWGSVTSVVLILGGAQLAFIGLVGEYIARVFEEVKGRPLYFFKQVPAVPREVPGRQAVAVPPLSYEAERGAKAPEPARPARTRQSKTMRANGTRSDPSRADTHMVDRPAAVTGPRENDRGLFYDRMVVDRDWDETANVDETRRRLDIVFDRLLGGVSLDGVSLLDAGSGGGHFSAAAVERGARVTSLDVGDNLLAQVAKRCESERVKGSILDIPFDDGFFDVVLSSEVIEHTTDPRKALRELARVVRPGGRLLVTTPGRLWQPVVRGATRLGLRPFAGHENFVWPAVARSVLERRGISVERYFGFNLLPLFNARMKPLHDLTDRVGPHLPFLFVNFAIMGTKQPTVRIASEA